MKTHLQNKVPQIVNEFADYTWMPISEWMLWVGWKSHVGCEQCWEDSDDAVCWGQASCHGYYEGCGCEGCWVQDQTEGTMTVRDYPLVGKLAVKKT